MKRVAALFRRLFLQTAAEARMMVSVIPAKAESRENEGESMSKKHTNRKGRNKGFVSGGFAAFVLASMFHPFRFFDIALVGVFAYLIGKLVAVMSTGLDLTTHNKQDHPYKEMEEIKPTGNENSDSVIVKGQEMLRQIREVNDAIPDATLSRQMYELERLCVQIFKTVAENPAKEPQIRKFMSYYLPTTLKMLRSYRVMQDRGVSRAELNEAHKTLVRGMDMVLTACQKQLDNLFKAEILDVSTDIDVLEQMLKRDGFTDTALGEAAKQAVSQQKNASGASPAARTAASAQMGSSAVPTLDALTDDNGEDFVSYYHQKSGGR